MLEVGKPLPVNIYSDTGQLLLRKGQPIISDAHRDKLNGFNACAHALDALAWQRAYERMVHELLQSGADVSAIAHLTMPAVIRESDYMVGQQLQGGWLDLQEILRGILYQGGLAINPLQRLLGLESKVLDLLANDADDSLFVLFQALTDNSLGYCATHALLCAVVCELTAAKLALPPLQRRAMTAAALTMNIGMAREQDSMARQGTELTQWQRNLISEHAQHSVEILQGYDVDNPDWLDLVRWHHAPEHPDASPGNLVARRILQLADVFVARNAARKSRSSLSPLSAVKTMVMGASGEVVGLGSAMAQAVGFYPPGSFVRLANGEIAVSARRGSRANMPWVISIVDKDAIPISAYVCKDTSDEKHTIAAAVNFESVRVAVNLDKVRRARQRIAV
jgi:HD-GYP domain-containing protein (c-di-GMP phosphodiesterase class II)